MKRQLNEQVSRIKEIIQLNENVDLNTYNEYTPIISDMKHLGEEDGKIIVSMVLNVFIPSVIPHDSEEVNDKLRRIDEEGLYPDHYAARISRANPDWITDEDREYLKSWSQGRVNPGIVKSNGIGNIAKVKVISEWYLENDRAYKNYYVLSKVKSIEFDTNIDGKLRLEFKFQISSIFNEGKHYQDLIRDIYHEYLQHVLEKPEKGLGVSHIAVIWARESDTKKLLDILKNSDTETPPVEKETPKINKSKDVETPPVEKETPKINKSMWTSTNTLKLNEQVSRMKNMMNLSEGLDSLSKKVEPYSNFESSEELLRSINGRLIAAVQLQEWSLVEEIASDVHNFLKNKGQKSGGLGSALKSIKDKISTEPDWL